MFFDSLIIQTVDRKFDTQLGARVAKEGLDKFRESAMKRLYDDE